ncbi:MAG: hypothetical protein KKC21_01015, partial [Nitrospinae bacterium]|nr:hypothetical protein [Nitrospinota bacterium]
DNAGDIVTENLDEGIDTVQSNISYTLTDNLENLTLTGGALRGTGNELDNVIIGSGADNTLYGLDGNDTLDGGLGADIMLGGMGNDTYLVDNIGDVVIENVDEGIDTVNSSIGYTLTDNVENLNLTGIENLNGTGNSLDNVITGNSGDNILDGGFGADTMQGGTGDDTYIVDNIGDLIIENANEGVDSVYSSANHSLSANIENLILTGDSSISGTGNSLDNNITGNSGDNTIDGGLGADAMSGGAGDDTYLVDNVEDSVTENLNEGIDLVQSSITYALANNVENLMLTGLENINGTGNDLNNIITGNTGSNALSGLAGNDTLIGNAGNDTLDGGLGADNMTGGTGDDTYIVDNVGDVVTENLAEGIDTVNSSITYTLGTNLENLTLTGVDNLNGTGNALNNVITGNSGNNVIDGGLGADAMAGGAGDDTYIVDNTGDIITENLNEGIDTVLSSVDYTLSSNVENLVLTGDSAINGTGNELNNTISGTAATNVLNGDRGNDTIDGGTGNDLLSGGEGNDTYIYNIGDGLDSITDTSGIDIITMGAGLDFDHTIIRIGVGEGVAKLRLLDAEGNETSEGIDIALNADGTIPLETITFADGSSFNLIDLLIEAQTTYGTKKNDTIITGRNDDTIYALNGRDIVYAGISNDIIYGGNGNDTLYGEQGNDTLYGENGKDTLYGGNGSDTLYGGRGDDTLHGGKGNDTVYRGSGENTILFNLGDGNDIIKAIPRQGDDDDEGDDDDDSGDKIKFGAGIVKGNLGFVKEGDNLRVTINNAQDTLLIEDWFGGNYSGIKRLEFADGTRLTTKEINSIGYKMYGTEGNDTLTGSRFADTIYGYGGNDIIYGGYGNDIIDAGAGNDIIYGGYLNNKNNHGDDDDDDDEKYSGNDTYRFGIGSGQDTIHDYDKNKRNLDIVSMSSDISSNDIVFMKEGNDLLIFSNINDFVRVSSEFSSRRYGIERLEVSDGSYVTRQDIENIVNSIAETNVTTGVDFVQQYNNLLNNQTYIASLTQSWHQPV